MAICKRVQYSGRVQGVGFRFAAQELARGFRIAGYVRNLHNGEVELVAEGPEEEVDGFLDAVARRMGERISYQDVNAHPTADFKDFRIRY